MANKEEKFELGTPGIVTVQDVIRKGKGITQVAEVETDLSKAQKLIASQGERIQALEETLDKYSKDEEMVDLQAIIETQEETIKTQDATLDKYTDTIKLQGEEITAKDKEITNLKKEKK